MNQLKALETLRTATRTLIDQTDDLLMAEGFVGDEELELVVSKLGEAVDLLDEKIGAEQAEDEDEG